MNSKKRMIKLPKNIFRIVVLLALACVLLYMIYLKNNATSIGGGLGQGIGIFVGRAQGSVEGMTNGRSKGFQDGIDAGLSAEDTEAELINSLKEMENLEVLVASVKLQDIHSIGKDEDYKALYLMKGEVVFSVDMSNAIITVNGDDLNIEIPEPVGELYIDQSQVEKVAEYQKNYFKGDANSGFQAYLNSMAKVQKASADTLNNYDTLMENARSSAINQIKTIANAATVNKRNVNVEFSEG